MKITGIEEAVKDYKEANAGGMYSSMYGYLMLDRATGEVWTDEFVSLGHNSWKQYHDKSIVNLERWALNNLDIRNYDGYDVNERNVKYWAEAACKAYEKENN